MSDIPDSHKTYKRGNFWKIRKGMIIIMITKTCKTKDEQQDRKEKGCLSEIVIITLVNFGNYFLKCECCSFVIGLYYKLYLTYTFVIILR